MTNPLPPTWLAPFRDLSLLIGGMLLLGYEAVIAPEPRLVVLGIAAAMMGLPAGLIADRAFSRTSPPSSPAITPEPAPTDREPQP